MDYCKYWEEKHRKAVKTLRSIGFPLEIIVSAAGIVTPVILWIIAHG